MTAAMSAKNRTPVKLAQNMPTGIDLPGFLVSPVRLTPQPRPTWREENDGERDIFRPVATAARDIKKKQEARCLRVLRRRTGKGGKDDAEKDQKILKAGAVKIIVNLLVLVKVAAEAAAAWAREEVADGRIGCHVRFVVFRLDEEEAGGGGSSKVRRAVVRRAGVDWVAVRWDDYGQEK